MFFPGIFYYALVLHIRQLDNETFIIWGGKKDYYSGKQENKSQILVF